MSTITIDNNLHSDLEKASQFTGMNEREITERALILYLDSLRNVFDLKAELDAWQELGLQSLRSVEDMLHTPLWVSGSSRAKTYGKDLGCPLRTVGFGFGLSLPPPFC